MSNQSNIQRGQYMMIKNQGYDPGAIVGEGNLLPTPTNVNAWAGIPSGSDRAPDVQERELDWSDKAAPPPTDPPGARGYTSKGDPFAGKR